MTWRPPVVGVTDRTFLVSVECALLMLVTASYTQVLPIATGNGAEAPVAPDGLAVASALVVALALAVLDVLAAGLPPDAADVLAAEPHPASVIAATPARAARADMYLPMCDASLCEITPCEITPWDNAVKSRLPANGAPRAGSTLKGRATATARLPNPPQSQAGARVPAPFPDRCNRSHRWAVFMLGYAIRRPASVEHLGACR